MPHYRITFDDGSSVEKTAATPTDAKREAKIEAQQQSGATSRTDPRVKVASVTDLDADETAGEEPSGEEGGEEDTGADRTRHRAPARPPARKR